MPDTLKGSRYKIYVNDLLVKAALTPKQAEAWGVSEEEVKSARKLLAEIENKFNQKTNGKN